MKKESSGSISVNEILSLLADFQAGRLAHRLKSNEDPRFKLIIDKLAEIDLGIKAHADASFIVESLGIGIWKWDLITNSLEWDKNMYRLYGANPDDFSGAYNAWESSLSADTKARAVEEITIAVAGGKPFDTAFQVVQRNTGNIQEIRTRGFVIRDENGKALKMWGINIDRTGEAELERLIQLEVREKENTLLQLNEAQKIFQMGSWQFALDTQRITWSDELFEIFKHDKLLGSPSYEVYMSYIHPDSQAETITAITECIQNGTPYILKQRLVHPDRPGELVWIEGRGRAVKCNNGKILRLVGTVRVITEEVEIKRQLEIERAKSIQNTKLASLGEMAGGVAHEINNPLAVIQSRASMLLKQIRDNNFTPDDAIKKLEKIVSTSERIAKIVRGLGSFARNADKDPFASVSIQVLTQNVLSFCSERFKTHGISLEICPILEDLTLECRSTQIEQVLLNVLGNAYDAVESLSEKWVKLEAKKIAEKIEIRVTDSGKGIAADIVEKIMQPFYTTKIVGKGTGLGLSISKGIIEDHKGTLRYDGSTGNTQFVITLPLCQS